MDIIDGVLFDISMPSSRNSPEFPVEFGKKVHHGSGDVKRWILGFWRMTSSKHWRKRAVSNVWSLEDLDEVDDSVAHQHVVPQPIEHLIALLQNERLGRNQNWSRSTSFLQSTYQLFCQDRVWHHTNTKHIPKSCISVDSNDIPFLVFHMPVILVNQELRGYHDQKIKCHAVRKVMTRRLRQDSDEMKEEPFFLHIIFPTNFGSLSKEWNQSLWYLAWH